jgi:hypothetical protein
MKKIDYKELAKGIALSCYDKAKDNDSNNGTTYLDYYDDEYDIDNIDTDELCNEIMQLRNVIQVDYNNFNDNDICVVFASMKYSWQKYEKILNKKGVI